MEVFLVAIQIQKRNAQNIEDFRDEEVQVNGIQNIEFTLTNSVYDRTSLIKEILAFEIR